MLLNLGCDWQIGDLSDEAVSGRYSPQSHQKMTAQSVTSSSQNRQGAAAKTLFINLKGVRNVIPIIDSGETEDSWVLIMPRATESLRQYLDRISNLYRAQMLFLF